VFEWRTDWFDDYPPGQQIARPAAEGVDRLLRGGL